MDKSSRKLPQASRTGYAPYREIKNSQVNGSASVAELKEFLGTLHGRNPQEVIGIVSSSMLIQSLVVATIATGLFFALFTVGPYLLHGPPKAKNLATKPAAAAPAADPAATTIPVADKSTGPDAAKAAQAMGMDEVKGTSASDKPPDIDNLLDGVD